MTIQCWIERYWLYNLGAQFARFWPWRKVRRDEARALELTQQTRVISRGGRDRAAEMTQVILAEDEAQLRALIAEMLTSKGVQVCEAADGLEALKLLRANPGSLADPVRRRDAQDERL